MVDWVETKTKFFLKFSYWEKWGGKCNGKTWNWLKLSVNSFFCRFELNTDVLLILLWFRAQSGKLNCFKDAAFTM